MAFVITLVAAALPADAATQVKAGDGMTLTEAARIKFNRDARGDDRQLRVEPGAPSGDYARLAASFGMRAEAARGLSLEQVFVAKINHGEGACDRQLVPDGDGGMATRSPSAATGRAQLARSAGLEPSEAAGMSLAEIAAAKFARDGSFGD